MGATYKQNRFFGRIGNDQASLQRPLCILMVSYSYGSVRVCRSHLPGRWYALQETRRGDTTLSLSVIYPFLIDTEKDHQHGQIALYIVRRSHI